jgi:hypothetical protein
METFTQIMVEVTMAVEDAPQDILGATFHPLELHDKARPVLHTLFHMPDDGADARRK